MKWFYNFVCAAASICLLATPAFAHRLNIYAWLENDTVIVDCNFGQGHPAKGADVTVSDEETKQTLVTGKTGDNGYFSFRVPEVVRRGHGLFIDVNAGQGHRGDWTMNASELYAAASLTAGFDAAAMAPDNQNGAQNPSRVTLSPAPGANEHPDDHDADAVPNNISLPEAQPTLSAAQARDIVREEVEAKIAPIRQHIATQTTQGPSTAEIIGGIGWIIGIVGIILFFLSRRKHS